MWCCIVVLNVVYKIPTELFLRRVHDVTGDILHLNETYAVLCCGVFESLGLVREVIHFAQERGHPLGIVNFDQERAFNSIS